MNVVVQTLWDQLIAVIHLSVYYEDYRTVGVLIKQTIFMDGNCETHNVRQQKTIERK